MRADDDRLKGRQFLYPHRPRAARVSLIIDGRQTGETAIAIDMILKHKSIDHSANAEDHLYWMHVAVELKRSTVAQLFEVLRRQRMQHVRSFCCPARGGHEQVFPGQW